MKHVRAWIVYGPDAEEATLGHPESCTRYQSICPKCGCCEHCYHACDCTSCECASLSSHDRQFVPPRVEILEDET